MRPPTHFARESGLFNVDYFRTFKKSQLSAGRAAGSSFSDGAGGRCGFRRHFKCAKKIENNVRKPNTPLKTTIPMA